MLRGTAASVGKARRLRRKLTLPEGLLWRELRRHQTGFRFRKQHPAGPRFVLDFACLEARLAIEVDGEAHDRGTNPARDEARDEWLANQGFRTLRIPAREVLANLDGVIAHILNHCQANSSPVRGGGPPPKAVVEGLARTPKGGGPPPKAVVEGLRRTRRSRASEQAAKDPAPTPEQPLHHATHGPPPRTGAE